MVASFLGVNIESLVGRDVNAGVASMILAVGVFINLRGVASKDVFQDAPRAWVRNSSRSQTKRAR